MKKVIASLTLVCMLLLATPMTVFAHGHERNYGGTAQAVSYSACAVNDCFETGLHYHDGTAYTAHYYNDGHSYHDYCDVSDCAIDGYHGHDGVYRFGHTNADGHDYHQSLYGGSRHHR